MLLEKKIVRDVEVEIHVSVAGWFNVKAVGGEGPVLGSADTLDKAIAQAAPKLAERKVKVAIDFTTRAGEAGVATSLHAGTGNVMARIDGKSLQLDYRSRAVFIGITPERLAEYLQADKDIRAAKRTQAEIEGEFGADLQKVVEQAARAKVSDR